MKYLFLPNIAVQHANMLSSNYAATVAQPLAIYLFAHALSRKSKFSLERVAILYHDTQPLGEITHDVGLAPQQRRGATFVNDTCYPSSDRPAQSKRFSSISVQPVVTMNMRVSILIGYSGRGPRRPERALRAMKLAGGTIIDFERPQFLNTLDELRVPGGLWLVDRKDLINKDDPVSSMVSALSTKDLSWMGTATVGYSMISELTSDRIGIRPNENGDVFPHAFCEPLLGLIQFVGSRQIDENNQPIPFWTSRWAYDDTFIIENEYQPISSSPAVSI